MHIQQMDGQQRNQVGEVDHNDIFYKHKPSTTLCIIQGEKNVNFLLLQ